MESQAAHAACGGGSASDAPGSEAEEEPPRRGDSAPAAATGPVVAGTASVPRSAAAGWGGGVGNDPATVDQEPWSRGSSVGGRGLEGRGLAGGGPAAATPAYRTPPRSAAYRPATPSQGAQWSLRRTLGAGARPELQREGGRRGERRCRRLRLRRRRRRGLDPARAQSDTGGGPSTHAPPGAVSGCTEKGKRRPRRPPGAATV